MENGPNFIFSTFIFSFMKNCDIYEATVEPKNIFQFSLKLLFFCSLTADPLKVALVWDVSNLISRHGHLLTNRGSAVTLIRSPRYSALASTIGGRTKVILHWQPKMSPIWKYFKGESLNSPTAMCNKCNMIALLSATNSVQFDSKRATEKGNFTEATKL